MTPAAHRFSAELRRAMTRRKVSTSSLATAINVSERQISFWRVGRSLPYLASALRAADALDWPALGQIIRRARTFRCLGCKRTLVSEGTGSQRKYCDASCERLAQSAKTDGHRPSALGRRLELFGEAVGDFCGTCEPDGLCRAPECALRAVSPLPLVHGLTAIAPVVDGRKHRWDNPDERVRWSQKMKDVYVQDPQRRNRIADVNRARWAAMSPEQRAEIGRRISEGIRRKGAA